jgi:hypothetical protein
MLRATLLGALLATFATFVAGCGSDVGNDGALVGGSCEVSIDCTPDSVCRTGGAFPGGYCALSCGSDEDCPDGSTCVDREGGICLVDCATDADCRAEEGYACISVEARGAAGTVSACGI